MRRTYLDSETYFRSRGRILQMMYSFRWNLQMTGSNARASATWAILLNPGKPNLVATTPNIAAITPRANSRSVTSMIRRHPVYSPSFLVSRIPKLRNLITVGQFPYKINVRKEREGTRYINIIFRSGAALREKKKGNAPLEFHTKKD